MPWGFSSPELLLSLLYPTLEGAWIDQMAPQKSSLFLIPNCKSFTIRDPDIQTTLSNHVWELKDQDINYLLTWKIVEKSKSFNPITLQCLLCLSEVINILNPNLATLNSRSETYGFCRHRKKYLLENVKPLAFKGGALTYRYKNRWWVIWSSTFAFHIILINPTCKYLKLYNF